MKKTGKKLFSKVTALILAAVNTLGGFAKAEKAPFPRGEYRVYNVAIIGSDVVADRAVEESPGFNRNVMDNLCNVGTRLENFAEANILDKNKISLAGRELPRSSMILPEQRIIFCFYDVANVYTNPDVIRECPFALCPYTLNLSESYDVWEIHMARLRDFVKRRNEMCDLKFLGIVHGERNELMDTYINSSGRIAYTNLDNCIYQQTINADWIFNTELHKSCQRLINLFIRWDSREAEFKRCIGKSFPIVSCTGTAPTFYQEGEDRPVAAPPIVPRVQPTRPTLRPIAPESEAPEGAKKKSEQMPGCSGSNRRRSNSVDCDRLYMDCFALPQSNGRPTLICDPFREILKTLLDCDFYSNEIIDGFKKIKFDGACFRAEFGKFWGFWHSRGKRYSSPEEAYNDIFMSEKNKSIREAFKREFKKCIDDGVQPDQIVNALCMSQYDDSYYDYDGKITIESGIIETTREEGGVGCSIQ